ncbi:MAG: hypothetical protein H7Y36_09135 [Armatimonadetes bacterium]|nr:hypothetical protein [Akkermansiaceae bacterium]
MSPVEFEKLFQAAKAIEPAFQEHDFQQAIYLLPRWAGKAGDWEAAAEREIARPGGLGHAGYAKVLSSVLGYGAYGFIFAESKASWPLAEKGFEELRTTYPNSKRILNDYAYVVSVKGDDKPALKRLLEEIGPDFIAARWRDSPEYFEKMKIWANKPN